MCHYRATNMICNHSQNAVNDRCELIVFWFHYIKIVIYIDDLRQRNSLQLQCTQYMLLLFRKIHSSHSITLKEFFADEVAGKFLLHKWFQPITLVGREHSCKTSTSERHIYLSNTHSLPIPNQQMSHKIIYHQQYTRRIYFQFHTWTKKRWKPLNYAYIWT